MRRAIALCWLITINPLGAALYAKYISEQGDVSGTWVLDLSKSRLSKSQKEGLTDYVLTISHRGAQIEIVRRIKKGGRELVDDFSYYTDGRQEQVLLAQGMDVRTTWRKNRLYRRISSGTSGPFGSITVLTEDEWKLSPDGATLTRTVRTSRSGLDTSQSSEKYVFSRRS